MPAPVKVCPNCGQSTTLDIPICSACGHRYRTQFETPDSRTQAYTPSPSPRSSFGPTSGGPASSAPTGLTINTTLCVRCRSEIAPDSPVCRVCGTDQRAPLTSAPPASSNMPPAPAPYAPSQPPPYAAQTAYPPPPYAPPYPQTMYAPPGYRPPAPPPVVMYSPHLPYVYPPDDFEMFDLTRQYRDAKKLYWWMLILGLLVCWPLLFIAYSEHKKMNAIKSRVALRGVDPERWANPL